MTKKKKPEDLKKTGRKSKFTKEMQKSIKFLAEKGFTEQEIADALNIDQSTITKWKQKMPEFFTSLKGWKLVADGKVERSLYEKACGYSMPDTKFATYEGQITDSVEYTKHIPPSDTAMIFWLKNRQPVKWRDKKDVDNLHHISLEDFVNDIQEA